MRRGRKVRPTPRADLPPEADSPAAGKVGPYVCDGSADCACWPASGGGYPRAARLMDMLEEDGVVGPAEGAGSREVHADRGDQDEEF